MPNPRNNEAVVLLHGILRTRFSMSFIAFHLRRAGYKVYNIGYASRSRTIESIADSLAPKLQSIQNAHPTLHVVAHSMGGLIIRHMLARHPAFSPTRIVMLGTPNHGSEMADLLQDTWLFRLLYGKAGQQLTTRSEHPSISTSDLGIISGTFSFTPMSRRLFKSDSDGTVSCASTHINGMKDAITVPCSHSGLLMSKTVHRYIEQFLSKGLFS